MMYGRSHVHNLLLQNGEPLCNNEAASTEKKKMSLATLKFLRVQSFTGCTCTVRLLLHPLVSVHGAEREGGGWGWGGVIEANSQQGIEATHMVSSAFALSR